MAGAAGTKPKAETGQKLQFARFSCIFRWKSGDPPVVVGMDVFGRMLATHRWSKFGRQRPEERESKREVRKGRERCSDFGERGRNPKNEESVRVFVLY